MLKNKKPARMRTKKRERVVAKAKRKRKRGRDDESRLFCWACNVFVTRLLNNKDAL